MLLLMQFIKFVCVILIIFFSLSCVLCVIKYIFIMLTQVFNARSFSAVTTDIWIHIQDVTRSMFVLVIYWYRGSRRHDQMHMVK